MITTAQQERANFILDRANKMNTAKLEYSKNWAKYEKIWKFIVDAKTGDDSWRSSLADTWLFATIKTAQAAFADSKVIPIFSRHEDDEVTKTDDLRDIYTDVSDKGGMDMELYYARLDAFKLGTGFLKTVYVEDKREVQQIQKFDPETNTFTYKKTTIKDFDDPKTVRTSPYLMLVDEMAKADFQNTARDCIEIEIIPRKEAKLRYGDKINWDKEIPKSGGTQLASQLIGETQTNVVTTTNTNTKDPDVKTYRSFAPIELALEDTTEILHYWSKNMGEEGTDTYEILADGVPVQVDTKGKPSPIPYIHKQLPFTPIVYSPYSGDELWGAGIIEIGYIDAENIRKNREKINDRQTLSLFSPVFADETTEIDQKQLKLRPLSIITTKGGKPNQLQITGASNADFVLLDKDAESLKRATGIDERVLGMSPENTNLTATEVSFLREAAMKRLKEFASLLYKQALLREVKLKIQLFKQYYSSPFKQDEKIKSDTGVKRLKVRARNFKIKTGNVYVNRDINPSFFEGNIDADIDMRVLLPLTNAQLIAKWGQVLRDTVPFIQSGIINLDIEKIIKEYLNALEVNIDTLRKSDESEAISMAEGEHKLFADENTSAKMAETIYKDGTPDQFLSPLHIRRHKELIESDDKIGEQELRNLSQHIAIDLKNYEIKMKNEQAQQAQMQAQMMNNPMMGQIGGVRQQPQPIKVENKPMEYAM